MKRTVLAISIGAVCTGLSMGAWAQDSPDEETQENQTETQQSASEQDTEMEAEPEVTVKDSGEPEVTIESSGDSEMTAEEESQEQPLDEQEPTQQESASSQSSALMSLRVSDLEGMTITNQDGEKIGEVSQISQQNQTGGLYAIVGVGGFLGIGSTDIALDITEIDMQEDELVLKTNRTKDEIEESSEEYDEENFTQVDSDMTLSEASSQ
jgi:hypothetical protein